MIAPRRRPPGRDHRRARVVGLGAALAALPLLTVTPTQAATTPAGSVHGRFVDVPMSDGGFRLPARVQSGWITFRAHTSSPEGHQLEGFRLRHGATPAQVVDDITRAVSFDPTTSVAGVADTRRDAVLVGGPSADPATPVVVTLALRAGDYYFFDFDDFFTPDQHVVLHRLQVRGAFGGYAPHAEGHIGEVMHHGRPRFTGSSTLPARGTIEVRNASDELHEVLIGRVRRGTTDAALDHYYGSGSTDAPPYALESPLRGVAAMDPGRVAYVRFPRLTPGRYSLLCFAPDAASGLPHVVMGMHRVLPMRLGR